MTRPSTGCRQKWHVSGVGFFIHPLFKHTIHNQTKHMSSLGYLNREIAVTASRRSIDIEDKRTENVETKSRARFAALVAFVFFLIGGALGIGIFIGTEVKTDACADSSCHSLADVVWEVPQEGGAYAFLLSDHITHVEESTYGSVCHEAFKKHYPSHHNDDKKRRLQTSVSSGGCHCSSQFTNLCGANCDGNGVCYANWGGCCSCCNDGSTNCNAHFGRR